MAIVLSRAKNFLFTVEKLLKLLYRSQSEKETEKTDHFRHFFYQYALFSQRFRVVQFKFEKAHRKLHQ